jgi:hypothetical protein
MITTQTTFNIIAMLAVSLFIIILVYNLLKKTLKKELVNTLPTQLREIKTMFNNKDITLTMKIKKNGEVTVENFEVIEKMDYVG